MRIVARRVVQTRRIDRGAIASMDLPAAVAGWTIERSTAAGLATASFGAACATVQMCFRDRCKERRLAGRMQDPGRGLGL
jgi:hypothetical protein